MSSKYTLYNSIVKYSLYKSSTVTGENIRYLMSKYDIYEHEKYQPICTIYSVCQKKKYILNILIKSKIINIFLQK